MGGMIIGEELIKVIWGPQQIPLPLPTALRGSLLRLSVIAALLALAPVESALAQGAVKSVHKDWQIRCDTPPGAKAEQCQRSRKAGRSEMVTGRDQPGGSINTCGLSHECKIFFA